MVDVGNETEFTSWLKTQPQSIGILIAARASLRIVPLLVDIEENREHVTLSTFWRLAYAVSAAHWPDNSLLLKSKNRYFRFHVPKKTPKEGGSRVLWSATYSAQSVFTQKVSNQFSAIRSSALEADRIFPTHINLLYQTTQDDVDFVLSGAGIEGLASQALWLENIKSVEYRARWSRLSKELLLEDPNWSVWTDWYDALIVGNAPFIEAIEIGDPDNGQYGRCTLPEELYQDPPRLNAALRVVIDDYWAKTRKTIPSKKPASIRPVFKNGRLSLNATPLDPELEAELAAANLQAVRNEMRELAEDVRARGNINADPAVHLERTANLIPDGIPNALALFGLIRKEAILMECLSMINEQWPDGLAAHYRANCAELSKALDMFMDRRTARRQSIKSELEDQELDTVMVDMQAQTDILRDDDSADIIDVEISDALDDIAVDYAEATSDVSKIIIATDMVESQNNLLKTLAEEGLKPENYQDMNIALRNAYAGALPAGMIEGAAQGGRDDGRKIGLAIARANAGKETGLALFNKYPKIFGWMKNLPFIGHPDNTAP